MTRTTLRAALLLGILLLAAAALATTDDLVRAKLRYGAFHRGSLILDCLLCHQREAGGGKLNPFGKDYGAARGEVAPEGETEPADAFGRIEYRDSDGDGAVNIYEVRSDTRPGDAKAAPTVAEYHAARFEDWPARRVADSAFYPGLRRVRETHDYLDDRAVARVERQIGRKLTIYERTCQMLLARVEGPEGQRDTPGGALFLIDTHAPSGPMQVAVFVGALGSVAGVDIAFHNEPLPPPTEEPATAPDAATTPAPLPEPEPSEPSEDEGEDEGGGNVNDLRSVGGGQGPGYPTRERVLTFEKKTTLLRFVGWSLDNEDRWAEELGELIERDPEHEPVYEAVREAIRTALWLAEEAMPRPEISGEVGSVRRPVR